MRIAVLGGTGRTGRLVIDALLARGHTVSALARDPGRADLPSLVTVVPGNARDAAALDSLVSGADAVVSALGPTAKDKTLHREVAPALLAAMRRAGVRRFVGISGAGIDATGDRKSGRDRFISGLFNRLGGDATRDKVVEYETWRDSGLDWTLVRAPRLADGAATGEVEHDAHRSPRRTKITRADLAALVADVVDNGRYVGAAPLVANR